MNRLILLAVLLGLLSSCELQKRHYMKGFYVSLSKKHHKPTKSNTPVVKVSGEADVQTNELAVEGNGWSEKYDAPVELVLPPIQKIQARQKITASETQSISYLQKSSFNQQKFTPSKKIDKKAAEDTGLSFAICCFSAFLLLCLFGWIFKIMMAGLVFLTLIFLFLLIFISGASIASIIKSLKHIFTSDAAKMGLAVFAIILASIVLISFFSLVALFFAF